MDTPGLERLKTLHFSDSVNGLNDLIETFAIKDEPKPENGHTPESPISNSEAGTTTEENRTNLQKLAKDFLVENPIDVYNSKLFVGNISYKVREREFREFFEYFGKVLRVQILKDKKTRRSRGIGFVTYSSPLEGKRALNAEPFELTLDGRVMKVQWAERRRTLHARRQQEAQEREEKVKELQEVASQYSHSEVKKSKTGTVHVDESILNRLDDDSLSYILSFLSLKERIACERVSKRWCAVSRQSWVHIDHIDFDGVFRAFHGTGGLTDGILISVLKRACGLKSLDMSFSPYLLTTCGLQSIANHCKDIQFLNLSKTAVSSSCLKSIAESCPKLKVVILERCKEIGEKGLWWLLKSCTQIECLKVTESVRITGQCFHFFGPMLHTLKLTSCTKVTDTALCRLGESCTDGLKEFDITGCKAITSSGISGLLQGCGQIRKFEMCQTPYVDCDKGLEDLRLLSRLEDLNLGVNLYVTDSVLQAITLGCENLRSLNIEACHSITGTALLQLPQIPLLEVLNVSYLTEVTDDCVKSLAANGRLRTFTARACTQLTNDALIALMLHCDHLTEADFSSCYHIKDSLLEDERLLPRDASQAEMKVYIGGTSLSKEAAEAIESRIGRCALIPRCQTIGLLRNDRDPTTCGPLYSSESEDDFQSMNGDSDGQRVSNEMCSADDFLLNDDPTVQEDFCTDDVYIS